MSLLQNIYKILPNGGILENEHAEKLWGSLTIWKKEQQSELSHL